MKDNNHFREENNMNIFFQKRNGSMTDANFKIWKNRLKQKLPSFWEEINQIKKDST